MNKQFDFPNKYYFVEYKLYGMEKNILFTCFSQYSNWSWALEKLNDEECTVFEVVSIRQERW